jgi:hypothetical protein
MPMHSLSYLDFISIILICNNKLESYKKKVFLMKNSWINMYENIQML